MFINEQGVDEEIEWDGLDEEAWHWLALGLGTAFVLTASMTTAYRWLQTEDEEESDPRAEQVQELLKEAERLLAQGRGSSGE